MHITTVVRAVQRGILGNEQHNGAGEGNSSHTTTTTTTTTTHFQHSSQNVCFHTVCFHLSVQSFRKREKERKKVEEEEEEEEEEPWCRVTAMTFTAAHVY